MPPIPTPMVRQFGSRLDLPCCDWPAPAVSGSFWQIWPITSCRCLAVKFGTIAGYRVLRILTTDAADDQLLITVQYRSKTLPKETSRTVKIKPNCSMTNINCKKTFVCLGFLHTKYLLPSSTQLIWNYLDIIISEWSSHFWLIYDF